MAAKIPRLHGYLHAYGNDNTTGLVHVLECVDVVLILFFFSLRKSNHLFFGLSLASLARLSQKEMRAGLLGPSQFLYPLLFAPIRNVLIFLTEGNANEIREKNSQDRKENHQRMGFRIKLRTHCWKLSTMKTNLANPPPRGERQLSALNNIDHTSPRKK